MTLYVTPLLDIEPTPLYPHTRFAILTADDPIELATTVQDLSCTHHYPNLGSGDPYAVLNPYQRIVVLEMGAVERVYDPVLLPWDSVLDWLRDP
jgi:hypothetical protein